jgi:hypothetical protein
MRTFVVVAIVLVGAAVAFLVGWGWVADHTDPREEVLARLDPDKHPWEFHRVVCPRTPAADQARVLEDKLGPVIDAIFAPRGAGRKEYEGLEARADKLRNELNANLRRNGVRLQIGATWDRAELVARCEQALGIEGKEW